MLQKNFEGWRTFKGNDWKEKVNVSDFIQKNYTEYTGTADFLAQPTEKTKKNLAEVPAPFPNGKRKRRA